MSTHDKPILQEEPFNGTMVNNLDEVIRLGKQMEKLRSSEELKLNNRQSDPAQYEEG
ncbi:hypothetical protein QU593_15700 [Rossellomorea marisflavi]|uniref:hypothetical protein n=1 Tax=Rossellomorea marisflavi TaxID=189381 RepID=UPI0025B0A0F1|nr:hypothetical protein [Rossellomorea marisflavi]WJV17592.1 hypothetical protein QU593_15700 [Rossellomorea marisflavi]